MSKDENGDRPEEHTAPYYNPSIRRLANGYDTEKAKKTSEFETCESAEKLFHYKVILNDTDRAVKAKS